MNWDTTGRVSSFSILATATLLTSIAHADVQTESVKYDHQGVALQGYFAYDDAISGPRPGVLIVHEWWGLNDYAKQRARQLAKLGYVAFALDMYGEGKSTKSRHEAGAWSGQFRSSPLQHQRASAGLDVLRAHKLVDPKRITAIGYCFGGTTVLSLALSGADVLGVVSFHGNLPLPEPGVDITAKILVCHGAKDAFVSPERISAFQDAMHKTGADWQFIAYSDAVHSFTNPNAARAGIQGVNYNEAADRRSWQHMRLFFDELFTAQ